MATVMTSAEFVKRLKAAATDYKTLYVMGCFGAPMNSANKKRYTANHSYNKQAARTAMINAATADTFGFDCVCLIKGMETVTENTAPTNAMWRQGSKAVKLVTKEQMTAETKYQASIAPFRIMLKNGQISTDDYRVIDTILTEKYRPVFVQYISPN